MTKKILAGLSRRERQIMDVLYRLGSGSVSDVMKELSGETAYSTVRAQLRVLEEKGHLRHEEKGLRYVYLPKTPRGAMRLPALRHLIDTLFEGSSGKAVVTLIGDERTRFTDEELDRLEDFIRKARKGRKP